MQKEKPRPLTPDEEWEEGFKRECEEFLPKIEPEDPNDNDWERACECWDDSEEDVECKYEPDEDDLDTEGKIEVWDNEDDDDDWDFDKED